MAVLTPLASAVSVTETEDLIQVDTGPLRFGIRTGPEATLRWVELQGRRMVRANEEPLLRARLMESAVYDGLTDAAPDRRFLDAKYHVQRVEPAVEARRFTAMLHGHLAFDQGDRLPFTLRLTARTGAAELEIAVKLAAEGDFRHRFLRDLVLQLPLDLNWRKRVAQGGDQGLEWDTRYYYEFPGRLGLLPHPDRNEFRYFGVQQDSPEHFRIWRAESRLTPELTHQHGRKAAGWTSVYDASGGVLFALDDMADRAPKTLEVHAAGGGRARVLIYPDTAPAFPPRQDDPPGRVFGDWHDTTWLFYEGEHPEARPDRRWAERQGATEPRIGQRPAGPDDLWDANLQGAPAGPAEGGRTPLVRGGIPLSRGAFSPGTPVALTGPGGAGFPVQVQPLAYWPDGSVKWLHLVFPLDGTVTEPGDRSSTLEAAEGAERFQVTLCAEEPRDFVLHYGSGIRAVEPPAPVVAEVLETAGETGEPTRIRLDTGRLQVELGRGEHWMPAVTLDGHPLWPANSGGPPSANSGGPTAFVDFFRTGDTPYHARTTHPAGQADPGPVVMEQLEVEEAGPLRAVIRLQGRALSQQPTDVILRVEAYAGQCRLRLTHSVEFTRHDPRDTFLQAMGLRWPLALADEPSRVTVGGEDEPFTQSADRSLLLYQPSPMHYQVFSGQDGWRREVRAERRAPGWIGARDGRRGMMLAIRDFWQSFPKALSYSPERGELTAWLWPANGPLMDVRRYSNWPHLAQGESVGRDNRWVETHYYGGPGAPHDPFAGTSRTHELLVEFHADQPEDAVLEAVHADFQRPPLIYSGRDRYRETRVTLPLPDFDRFPNISENLDHFTDFWLFHQRYWNWYGMWDYGDVQHRFRGGGYGWKVAPDRLRAYLDTPEDERREFSAGRLILDYFPQQDWLFDNGRWGWTNTEGLPGLYFQQEYLRTGRRDVFFAGEALARHARDVVTRQSGRFFGQGTRHGVQHWSDGNHEERQTTFAEYRLHYYLTGEARSREVMVKLSDYYADLRGQPPRRADHSGRLYGLFTRWEMTGDSDWEARIRRYVQAMIVPAGFWSYADFRHVDEQGRARVPEDDEGINSRNMFFHNFGAMHGVLEYYRATKEEALREALVRSARATLQPGDRLQHGSASLGLLAAFGALYAETDDRFGELIRADMSDPGTGSRDAFRMVLPDPKHWTGDTAQLSRQIPLCWFYMVNLPVIMAAVEEEPELAPRIWARFHEANARERPVESRGPFHPRPSWQDEYDAPELSEYFEPWRPE